MYKNKKISVIIAAAGSGKRMGSGIPKQYLEIESTPMLIKTVKKFTDSPYVDQVVVVANNKYLDVSQKHLESYGLKDVITVVGGKERQDSVYQGLLKVDSDSEYIIIHDAARPFVSDEIINQLLEAVILEKAVIVGVPVKDTILSMATSNEGYGQVDKYLKRETLIGVQTPQAFEKKLIIQAYEEAFKNNFYGTDDGALVENLGHKVYIISGDYENIKVTTKEDLPMYNRVGKGYDVHKLVEGQKLVLGGVEIPFEKGLLGHSDADVLLHAIMDALLGAAALGDIGRHFPDTDENLKGISSLVLLKKVSDELRRKGYIIGNIDATVICEKPKIAEYVDKMRENISRELGIEIDRINVKGTTTEKLGFEGRGEGIASEAVCIINK